MNNPTATYQINNKLVTYVNNGKSYGPGIKTLQTNEETPQDVLTTLGVQATAGARYVTDDITNIGLGALTINTTALKYSIFCNAAGIAVGVKVTGVDGSLNEISETVITNGTTSVLTVNNYLCMNDIEQVSGSYLTSAQTVYCRPSSGQDKRLILNGRYKVNPYIMVGRKNGVNRRARLMCVNQVQQTAVSDYNLCVFPGTVATDTGAGIQTIPLRLRGLPNPVAGPINFGACGIVDIGLGELAVWYRSSTVSTVCNLTATWVFYNA